LKTLPVVVISLYLACLTTPIHATETIAEDALDGIEIEIDESHHETHYRPEQDRWSAYEYQFYPFIVADPDGRRSLRLYVSTQNEHSLRLKSLEIRVDSEPYIRELRRRDVETDRSGCRDTETTVLEGESDLIQDIVAAETVQVDFIGSRYSQQYELAPYDLSVFKKIARLNEMPELPVRNAAEEEAAANEPDGTITSPRLIRPSKVDPVFPEIAKTRKKRGTVTLHAVVRKDGSTDVIEVLKSTTPYCGFETAAAAAVEQWRYKPGFKDGEPVDVYFTVGIDFILW
jgi:TonB family protein